MHKEVHPRRLPRTGLEQRRICLLGSMRGQVLRCHDEGQREDAGRSAICGGYGHGRGVGACGKHRLPHWHWVWEHDGQRCWSNAGEKHQLLPTLPTLGPAGGGNVVSGTKLQQAMPYVGTRLAKDLPGNDVDHPVRSKGLGVSYRSKHFSSLETGNAGAIQTWRFLNYT